jgi:hypothetical protein
VLFKAVSEAWQGLYCRLLEATMVSWLLLLCEEPRLSLLFLQGDGVWLPRTAFQGAPWVTSVHRDLFSEYTSWSFSFLELAATAGAAKGFTEVIGFFHWEANNTGV